MLKANYSNSRLALLEFRRRIEAYQHAVIVWQLCRQVWARWMDTAVLAGAIDLPDYDQRRREYLACGWLPPKWDWIDPLKDARAEIEQIDAGLKSRTQALAERGYDAEQVDGEIAADRAREQSLGLAFRRRLRHGRRMATQKQRRSSRRREASSPQLTRTKAASRRCLRRRARRSVDSSGGCADRPRRGSQRIRLASGRMNVVSDPRMSVDASNGTAIHEARHGNDYPHFRSVC